MKIFVLDKNNSENSRETLILWWYPTQFDLCEKPHSTFSKNLTISVINNEKFMSSDSCNLMLRNYFIGFEKLDFDFNFSSFYSESNPIYFWNSKVNINVIEHLLFAFFSEKENRKNDNWCIFFSHEKVNFWKEKFNFKTEFDFRRVNRKAYIQQKKKSLGNSSLLWIEQHFIPDSKNSLPFIFMAELKIFLWCFTFKLKFRNFQHKKKEIKEKIEE